MKRILLTCVMLVFAVFTTTALAQNRTVSGKVTGSDDGLSLPQVTIRLKGTQQGTPSNADGTYSISVPSNGGTLVFSYTGYVTQEVALVAGQSVYNIQMSVDATSLGEVVVTAQGIARERKSLGYSIGEVDNKLLEARPTGDIGGLLKGKVAGLTVTTPGGFLGRQAAIQVRGQSSATGNNNALVIIDGVYSDFSRYQDLDPNNIASFNVLKGLAAATLYGQEGRNGVLLIETKSNTQLEEGQNFTMTINQQFIANQISNLPDFQNTYGQGADNNPNVTFIGNWGGRFDNNFIVPGHYATGRVPGLDVIFPELQEDVLYQAFPNNVSDFFNTNGGIATSVNANARVGNTSIGFSAGFNDQVGYIEENNQTRVNLATSINSDLTDRLNLSTSFRYSEFDVKTPTFNFFDRLLYLPRNLDIQGLPFENPLDGSSIFYRPDLENPLWQLANTSSKNERRGFNGTVGLNYKITDKITAQYKLGLDSYTTTNRFVRNRGGLVQQGVGRMQTTSLQRQNFDHNILIQGSGFRITDDIELNTTLGFNARSFNTRSFGINSTDQVVSGFFRHGNFRTHLPTGNSNTRVNIFGLYGQATFSYRNYLFVELSGRNDWGSQVERENATLFYPSASVSFVPTDVWEGLKSNNLNSLRVRLGYGTSAGYPPPFQTRAVLNANAQAFVTNDGTNISTNAISTFQPNPGLVPERQREVEAGINAKLFNYKVDLDISLYSKVSEDQVLRRTLPGSTGFGSTRINAGRIDTKGIEAAITVRPIETNNFTWSILNNFTAYETTVIDLPEEFINLANGLNFAIEGQPLNVFRLGYQVRDDEGNALINPEDGTIIGSGEAGLIDRVIGDPNPDFTYTMINGFTYKNLNLTVQVDYRHGGDIFSNTASSLLRRGVTRDTEDREGTYVIPGFYGDPNTGEVILDENGQKIPNRIQLGANDLYFLNAIDVSENIVFDGTTLRIREIDLNYSMPSRLLQKLPFQGVNISFNVQNAWFRAFNFPEHMNFDPEVGSGNANGLGFDTQTDPSMRSYSLSLRLTL